MPCKEDLYNIFEGSIPLLESPPSSNECFDAYTKRLKEIISPSHTDKKLH